MALKDIIGQDRALSILKGCALKNRVPHALFFAGDEGIGKRLTALNYAKALNCLKEPDDDLFAFAPEEGEKAGTEEIEACDRCSSCRKIDNASHPDVFFIGPEGDGGQITVAAIRELEASISYKPFEGNWKIAIVDEADRLNPSAANAFLRTLEEPPPQSIFILISSRPDMLLPTIISRCQRVSFNPLPAATMSSLLEEKFEKLDHDSSKLLGALSGGRLGKALNEDLIIQRDRSFDILKQLMSRPEGDVWADRAAMDEWFDWAQLWLREIAVFKATGRKDLIINQDRQHDIEKISSGAKLRDILKLARELYNIKRRLNFNLNKQLTLNYTNLIIKSSLGKTASRFS